MVNMFSVIINSTVIYWATALDLLILLAILYVRFDKKSHLSITLGQIIGSFALVVVSLFFCGHPKTCSRRVDFGFTGPDSFRTRNKIFILWG